MITESFSLLGNFIYYVEGKYIDIRVGKFQRMFADITRVFKIKIRRERKRKF